MAIPSSFLSHGNYLYDDSQTTFISNIYHIFKGEEVQILHRTEPIGDGR